MKKTIIELSIVKIAEDAVTEEELDDLIDLIRSNLGLEELDAVDVLEFEDEPYNA